ncbi:hypothetical protein GQR58_014552 [Nymphon striatum]|nr:hypothetical protein GQR58_014552 [Nymphon striatum]
MESHTSKEDVGASDTDTPEVESLQSAANDEEFLSKLRKFTPANLTNHVVWIITKRMPNKRKKTGPSWKHIKEALAVIMHDPLSDITEQYLRASMMSVKTHVANYNKYKDDIHIRDLELYLKSNYTLPGVQGQRTVSVNSGQTPTRQIKSNKKINSFDKDIASLVNKELLEKSENLENVNHTLNREVKQSKKIIAAIQKSDKQRTIHANTVKKHNTTISNLKRSKAIWKKNYLASQQKVKTLLAKNDYLLKDNNKFKKKNLVLKKLKTKNITLVSKDHEQIQDLCEKEKTMNQLKCELQTLDNKVCELEEELTTVNQPLSTRSGSRGRCFNSKIREAS